MEALKKIIQKRKLVFTPRLDSRGPGKGAPKKIGLDENKTPVKVEFRKYSAEKRSFLNHKLVKLVSMDFN